MSDVLSFATLANYLHLDILPHMEQNIRNPKESLKAAGLRATKSRLIVLQTLAEEPRPLSIRDLEKYLSPSRVNYVTLYRMMGTFVTAGIVSKIELGRGHATFELKKSGEHHHIVCTDCNRIEDFDDTMHTKIAARIIKRSHAFDQLTDHSFELFGLCNSCVKTTANS